MKKIIRFLLYSIIIIVVIFSAFTITAIVKDYEPDEITLIEQNASVNAVPDTLEFSLMSWNLGYCGLSEDMDFFYDGGKQVHTSEKNVKKNLKGVINFLKPTIDSIDFFLLQEVDKKSKRSYFINEVDSISKEFADYKPYFGKNYDVFMVPQPITNPYGKVVSGLLSLSRFVPTEVVRHSFPGNYSFPLGLFMLDRCFLVTRFKVSNGKELLIINTHNSAYDDGSLRERQMEYLKKFLLSEYKNGNYIVVAGDWNQCPPGLQTDKSGYMFDTQDYKVIKDDCLPADWKWVFCNDKPTNRRVHEVWNPETTLTTIIDFFLISPNIENINVENINLNFEFSDHNPVFGKFKLKPIQYQLDKL